MCNYTSYIEHGAVYVFRVHQILAEGPLCAVALGLGHLGLHGRIVPSVGIVMELLGELLADKARQRPHPKSSQVPDGPYPICQQAFLRFLSHP